MSRKKKAVGFRYTPKESKAVQDLARHQMIEKLLQDILVDLVVCKLEGWDPFEYIRLLREAIPVPPDEKAKNTEDRNA